MSVNCVFTTLCLLLAKADRVSIMRKCKSEQTTNLLQRFISLSAAEECIIGVEGIIADDNDNVCCSVDCAPCGGTDSDRATGVPLHIVGVVTVEHGII